jgi:polar amino acid transport system substrate-binding protein
MKKLLIIASLILFTAVLSACKTSSHQTLTCGDLESSETLTVGMDLSWPPFETRDTNRVPTGISVDLACELGDYLGMKIIVSHYAFGSLIPALETGEIDVIIASMSITEPRKEKINFSAPYFHFPLITVLNSDVDINSRDELMNTPGVRFVGPRTLVSLSIPREQANQPIIREVADQNSAILEIISGQADAFIISASSAVEYHLANPTTTKILYDVIDLSPIGMGTRKGEDELLASLNAFIAQLESGGVYDRLREKYDSIVGEALEGQGLDFYIHPDA